MAASDSLGAAVGVVMSGGSAVESALGSLTPDESVRMLQSTLNALLGTKLKVDGVVGTQTLTAFLRAQKQGNRAVSAIASAMPIKLPASIPFSDLGAIIDDVSSKVPAPKSYLNLLIKLEPRRVEDLVLLDRTGTFVGITQFNQTTYDDTRREVAANPALLSKGESLPPFSEFLGLPPEDMARVSLLAAGAYHAINRRRLARFLGRSDFKYTDELAYLAHNQGAYGASEYVTSGVLPAPKQSPKALSVMAKARESFA